LKNDPEKQAIPKEIPKAASPLIIRAKFDLFRPGLEFKDSTYTPRLRPGYLAYFPHDADMERA
jgi:hypothetical protein